MIDQKTIDNLRKAAGTLPSESPVKNTRVLSIDDTLEISIEDHSKNPYKAMYCAATSTWGDNDFKPKWSNTSIEGKLEVIKAVLTHNTLPQAKEMVNFVFRVRGVPRWLFDYHTQIPFTTFMSIGCRDNNKIDSDVVVTADEQFIIENEYVFLRLKDLYEKALGNKQASWQSARTFLPQSYLHAYHFSQNLLSIVGTKGFHASKLFGNSEEEKALKLLYLNIIMRITKLFPLIGYYAGILTCESNDQQKLIFETISNLTVDKLSKIDIKYLNKK